MAATYDIEVKRVPGQGSPVFFVKMMDSGVGWPARADNNHYSSEPHPNKTVSVQNLTLT